MDPGCDHDRLAANLPCRPLSRIIHRFAKEASVCRGSTDRAACHLDSNCDWCESCLESGRMSGKGRALHRHCPGGPAAHPLNPDAGAAPHLPAPSLTTGTTARAPASWRTTHIRTSRRSSPCAEVGAGVDGCVDGWVGGWVGGWMGGWVGGCASVSEWMGG